MFSYEVQHQFTAILPHRKYQLVAALFTTRLPCGIGFVRASSPQRDLRGKNVTYNMSFVITRSVCLRPFEPKQATASCHQFELLAEISI